MSANATTAEEFISRAEAKRRLALSDDQFTRLLARGLISRLKLPGCRETVSAADVDRLVAENTTRAVAK